MDREGDAHRLRIFKRFCARLMVCALGDRGVPPTGLATNRCHCSPGLPALCGTLPMFEPDRRSRDRDCRESLAHRGAQRRVRSCGLRRKRAGTEGVCLGGWREEMVRACFTGALLLRLDIAELHPSRGALISHRPHVRPSTRCDGSPTPGLVSIGKSDTRVCHSLEVMEMLDQLFITGLRGRIRQLCRNTQLGAAQHPRSDAIPGMGKGLHRLCMVAHAGSI